MDQAFASDNSKKGIFSRFKLLNFRKLLPIIFTILLLVSIVLIYFGTQQQKVYKTRASESTNNVCDLATNEVCKALNSSQCLEYSFGCCKNESSNDINQSSYCVKDSGKNIKCDALGGENFCGKNKFGVDSSTLCQWNATENKCVDKTIIKTSSGLEPEPISSSTQSANISGLEPEPIPSSTQSARVDLNLKLSFQGISSKPKVNNELKVKVKLVDSNNIEKVNDNSVFTADDYGVWSGSVSFEGVNLNQKYYLLLKGPMHVQKKICAEDAADTDLDYYSCQFGSIVLKSGVNDFDFSKVKMFVGDVPAPTQNGVTNAEDIKAVTDALSLPISQRKNEELLNNLDFNLDGIVSTQDLSLIISALKTKTDEK